jgi:hypothetical protein
MFLHSVLRLLVTANFVPTRRILSSWWWMRYVPPKYRLLQEPHGVTSQKTSKNEYFRIKSRIFSSSIVLDIPVSFFPSVYTDKETRWSNLHSFLRHVPVNSFDCFLWPYQYLLPSALLWCHHYVLHPPLPFPTTVLRNINSSFAIFHPRTFALRYRPRTKFCHVRFEVFAAVIVKNIVFWDMKPSSYLTGNTILLYRARPVNAM